MKPIVGLALVLTLVLGGCSLPGMTTPTPELPVFPPVATKPASANTLPPLPTFTKLAITPPVVTATTAPKATATQPAATQPPAAQPTATNPPAPAQPTATQVPPTATKAAPTSAPSSTKASLFFVAIGDDGKSGIKIGCGDSLVPVSIPLDNPSGPLRSSLEQLLAMHNQYYGQSGLYNALFRSDLTVQSVTIQNGVAEIKLSGALTLGGVCDNPRVQAQLEAVALQFSTVQQANITINGKALKDILSLK